MRLRVQAEPSMLQRRVRVQVRSFRVRAQGSALAATACSAMRRPGLATRQLSRVGEVRNA